MLSFQGSTAGVPNDKAENLSYMLGDILYLMMSVAKEKTNDLIREITNKGKSSVVLNFIQEKIKVDKSVMFLIVGS